MVRRSRRAVGCENLPNGRARARTRAQRARAARGDALRRICREAGAPTALSTIIAVEDAEYACACVTRDGSSCAVCVELGLYGARVRKRRGYHEEEVLVKTAPWRLSPATNDETADRAPNRTRSDLFRGGWVLASRYVRGGVDSDDGESTAADRAEAIHRLFRALEPVWRDRHGLVGVDESALSLEMPNYVFWSRVFGERWAKRGVVIEVNRARCSGGPTAPFRVALADGSVIDATQSVWAKTCVTGWEHRVDCARRALDGQRARSRAHTRDENTRDENTASSSSAAPNSNIRVALDLFSGSGKMALDMVTTLCQGEDPVADLVLAFDVSLDRMLSEALEHPQIVVVKFDVDRLCFAELIALFDIVAIHASPPCTANSASSNGVYANLIDTFGDEHGTRRIFERLRSSDKLVEIVFDIAALAAASLIALTIENSASSSLYGLHTREGHAHFRGTLGRLFREQTSYCRCRARGTRETRRFRKNTHIWANFKLTLPHGCCGVFQCEAVTQRGSHEENVEEVGANVANVIPGSLRGSICEQIGHEIRRAGTDPDWKFWPDERLHAASIAGTLELVSGGCDCATCDKSREVSRDRRVAVDVLYELRENAHLCAPIDALKAVMITKYLTGSRSPGIDAAGSMSATHALRRLTKRSAYTENALKFHRGRVGKIIYSAHCRAEKAAKVAEKKRARAAREPPGPIEGSDVYEIDKVLERRVAVDGAAEVLVSWKGYSEQSWVRECDVRDVSRDA